MTTLLSCGSKFLEFCGNIGGFGITYDTRENVERGGCSMLRVQVLYCSVCLVEDGGKIIGSGGLVGVRR